MAGLAQITGLHLSTRLCGSSLHQPRSSSAFPNTLHCQRLGIDASPVDHPSVRQGRAGCEGSRTVAVRAAAGSKYGNQQQAFFATRKGMQLFTQGDVEGSLVEFDRALELDPSQRPYLWQRGLSLYYLDQFEEGAKQFREDVAVNPNDTEEAIWCYLCEAKLYGINEARNRYLKVGADSRPYMRKAYELFRDGGSPESLLEEAGVSNASRSWFYAKLYAGLYYESEGDVEAAQVCMSEAAASQYTTRAGDYMAAVAEVHCNTRGWEVVSLESSDYFRIAIALFGVSLPLILLFSNR